MHVNYSFFLRNRKDPINITRWLCFTRRVRRMKETKKIISSKNTEFLAYVKDTVRKDNFFVVHCVTFKVSYDFSIYYIPLFFSSYLLKIYVYTLKISWKIKCYDEIWNVGATYVLYDTLSLWNPFVNLVLFCKSGCTQMWIPLNQYVMLIPLNKRTFL